MTLTKEEVAKFREAIKPLVKFLNDTCHPHAKITVDATGAQIYEGLATARIEEYLKD